MFNNKKEVNQISERHQESSLFGKGSTFKGTIEANENVRVDGKIIGEITTKAKIVAGTDSVIEGNVHADRAELSGVVKGDIYVADILILRSSARIDGDIYTDKLIMDEGSSFNGKCKVGSQVKELLMETSKKENGLNGHKHTDNKEFISAAG